jgi:hypothetical protein
MIAGLILNVKQLRSPLIVKERGVGVKNIKDGFPASPAIILFHIAAASSSA